MRDVYKALQQHCHIREAYEKCRGNYGVEQVREELAKMVLTMVISLFANGYAPLFA